MSTVLVKNSRVRIIYLAILAGICFWGMLQAFDGTMGMFMYFTYISNAMVLLTSLAQIGILLNCVISKKKPSGNLQIPAMIRGVVLICISFTFLTIIFVLNPFQMPNHWQDAVVHYIVPILSILDFVLFQEHGRFKWQYPFYWGLAPIIYYGYVLILYHLGFRFGNELFPYFFMNHVKYGWRFVLRMQFILLVVFIGFGFLIYVVDFFLGKKNQYGKMF